MYLGMRRNQLGRCPYCESKKALEEATVATSSKLQLTDHILVQQAESAVTVPGDNQE